jgi:hypothetical protein
MSRAGPPRSSNAGHSPGEATFEFLYNTWRRVADFSGVVNSNRGIRCAQLTPRGEKAL